MFDTHAHLAYGEKFPDVAEVLNRAWNAGLSGIMIATGTDAEMEAALPLAAADERLVTMVGYHPETAERAGAKDVERLRPHLGNGKVCAIGEIGLDYYWKDDAAVRTMQRDLLRAQLLLAKEAGLPPAIHVRDKEGRTDAWDDLFTLLDETGVRGGILHCFTGDLTAIHELRLRDFSISFSGIVTFPNAEALRDASRHVPLDRILLETDAPFLAPVPHRGERSEPAHIRATASVLAATREIPFDDLWSAAGENAARVLGLVAR